MRAAWVGGVPHPTGYPLWVLLAHIATLFPGGEPAHRVALLSALAAAVAVAAVGLASRELALAMPPDRNASSYVLAIAPSGALLLSVTPLFWQQATIPETYALDSALCGASLWLLLRWRRGAAPLWVVTFTVSLALTNHLVSLAIVCAVVAALGVRPRPTWPSLLVAAVPFVVTAFAYLALLWRAAAHPIANWGDPETLPALWAHVTAREYSHFLTGRTLDASAAVVAGVPLHLVAQITPLGTALIVAACYVVVRGAFSTFLPLLVTIVANLVLVSRDSASAGEGYLHLTYLVLAIVVGAGLAILPVKSFVADQTRQVVAGLLVTLVGGLALWQGTSWYAALDLHQDYSLENQASADLAAAPPNTLLLTEDDNPLFALWYVQDVLGVRPDVLVWSVSLVQDPWYGRVMHWRYPSRVPADLPTEPQRALAAILHANAAYPIYLAPDSPYVTRRFAVSRVGPLFQVGAAKSTP